jgi:hypothetical protein
MLIKRLFKENNQNSVRVDVYYSTSNGYSVEMYSPDGSLMERKNLENSTINEARFIAEDWIKNVSNLHG